MTLPAGSPAWTRTSSAETYGGDAGKRDYQGMGPVNPRTDVSAAQFLRLTADVSALARVAPLCVLTVQCNDSGTPAPPTVLRLQQMNTVSLSGYEGDAPPDASLPTLSRFGNGAFVITWPSSIDDEYGTDGSVGIVHVIASPQDSSSSPAYVLAEVQTPNSVLITVFDDAGIGRSDSIVTVEVA